MTGQAIKKKTVFVGLSGGVDSSVAAYLLQRDGYNVVGVYLKCWEGLVTTNGVKYADACQWRTERRDAAAVAALLKIPFRTYDFTAAYQTAVVDDFFNEYRMGRTPNPDVACNRAIKFGAFLEQALRDGADFVATGHYARRREEGNHVQLCVARDTLKDQSYFLWTLTEQQLQHTLFPIGQYTKPQVRDIAHRANLSTAQKKDSQGICFIGPVPVAEFIRDGVHLSPGDIKTDDGKIVGRHNGAALYTVGQRRGIAVAAAAPYYVARVDVAENVVYVVPGYDHPALYQTEVLLERVSWVGEPPQPGRRYRARIRYRQPLEDVTVVLANTVRLLFAAPQRAVTAGQSAVLYEGDVLVGGGIIGGSPTS